MTDEQFINFINGLFVKVARPEHFTNFTHCSECLEHDETLQAYTVETLPLEPMNHSGWDPICFINSEGFQYYFPALVRLALTTPVTEQEDSYIPQLLFHLSSLNKPVQHFSLFTQEQKEAVLALLHHIHERHQETIVLYGDEDTLETAINQWKNVVTGGRA